MSDRAPSQDRSPDASEVAPFFRSWGVWYGLVLAVLAFLILALALFGRAFS